MSITGNELLLQPPFESNERVLHLSTVVEAVDNIITVELEEVDLKLIQLAKEFYEFDLLHIHIVAQRDIFDFSDISLYSLFSSDGS